uniref:structural maintenance of chromosomes protein 5-like n=1 Tax=Styela clava TaxID=7725 RepID=UPI00193A925B|nr:structural maintenance of chromosomes protein 5-like [Styela clava]
MEDDESYVVGSGQSNRKSKKKFTRGSIVRIAAKDFLTYDSFQFSLNPKLNVIIGPNGTGKSSIVCAICLGLGGKTNYLARAKDVGEYIKYGQTKAIIEIELYDEPKNILICREIVKHTNSNKSTTSWYRDGVLVSAKIIEETVSGLNIQLSNLCQFLPQEKVADFAKMNKIELLENTELAVCDPQTYKDHMSLKDFRGSEKQLQTKHLSEIENLDMMKRKNERMEQDVVRFKERKNLLEKAADLEKKRAWTVYEDARKKFVELKQHWEQVKKECNEIKKDSVSYEKELDKSARGAEEINQEMRLKGEKLKAAANATKKIHDQISAVEDSIKDKEIEFEEKEKYEQQRLKKLEQCHLMVDSWKKEMSELSTTDVQPQIDEISKEIHVGMKKINNIEFDVNTLQEENQGRVREMKDCDRKIAHLNNLSNRRLEWLKMMNKDMYEAVEWFRKNKQNFKGNVYEPIMLLLNMTDDKCAEILENHVAVRDMMAFVCENPEDNALLVSELRGKRKLKINVVKAPRDRNGKLIQPKDFKPQRPIEQLSDWGFTSYLREMFTAPDPVMSFLCKQYGVHRVPIGTQKTMEIVEQVTKHSGQNLFYIPSIQKPRSKEVIPGIRFSVRKSKYSGNSTVANRSLKQPNYLTTNVDPDQILEVENRKKELYKLNQEVTEKIADIQRQKKVLEKRDNELRSQKKELQQLKSRKKTLENNIQMKLKTIEELQASTVDIESLRKDLRKSLGKIYMGKKQLALKFSKNIKECTILSLDKAHTTVKYVAAIAEKNKIEEKIRQGHARLLESRKKLEQAEGDKKDSQLRAKQLLVEAKQKTGGENCDEMRKVGEDLMKLFSTLPDTVEEMDTLIHDFRARAECCTATDPQVVDEYNRRQREIEVLQKRVDDLQSRLNRSRSEIDEVRTRWLTCLKKLVTEINGKFSKYFAQMGCAGEVDLHADNPEEYDKYGIRIRVKFRSSSSLQELNPFRQSGGERSVSTMLYLMALQSLRKCPFRLVDEINQGMDPYNERRVFEIIVRSSSERDTSQYFLITPKLLPNLTYNEHMTVHCIYNGHFMLPCSQWKLSRFKRRRRHLRYEDDD